MSYFVIIENDAGLAVTEVESSAELEDEAIKQGGVIVDPGPYNTFDDAYDSLLTIQREEAEDGDLA